MNAIFVNLNLKGRGVVGDELFISDNEAEFTVEDGAQLAVVQSAIAEALKAVGIQAASLSKKSSQ